MISVICPYNNEDILNEMIVKSLEKQTFRDYELIFINTKIKKYKSAAEALNYGASVAKGEYLLFVHQDIEFLEENGLQQLNDFCQSNDFGVAGVAGATGATKYQNHTSVVMGKDRRQAGQKLESIMEAYALDECLMIVKRDKFIGFRDYGQTWHFYGPDISLQMKSANEKVLLFPVWIYHLSAANSLNYSYFNTLLRFAKNHRDEKIIRTCCGYFHNNSILWFYCEYRKFKLFLKKLLKK